MSSPINIDSLSGLAEACTKLQQDLIENPPTTHEAFNQIRHLLNNLQVACPNHKGIQAARVKWFDIGLDDFEARIVVPFERGESPFEFDRIIWESMPPPKLLLGPQNIDHFLKRGYLKDAFPHRFERVVKFYDRLAVAKGLGSLHQEVCKRMAEELRTKLVQGKL